MIKPKEYSRYPRWESPTFPVQMKVLWRLSTGEKTAMEHLMDKQVYRPLTAPERARFLKKQECLADNRFSPKRFDDCRYYWGTDFDAYYRDNPN